MNAREMTVEQEFNRDFIKAQKKIGTLEKTASGHAYKYADLTQTIICIKEAIGNESIGFIQHVTTSEKGRDLVTTLLHTNGHQRDFAYPIVDVEVRGGANAGQNFGASVTYSKRYALQAIFGIATEDTDLNIKRSTNGNGYHKPKNAVDSEDIKNWAIRQTDIAVLAKKHNDIMGESPEMADFIKGHMAALKNGGPS